MNFLSSKVTVTLLTVKYISAKINPIIRKSEIIHLKYGISIRGGIVKMINKGHIIKRIALNNILLSL
ncbi:hypothetical protein CCYN2B_170095 [Capnocytophaga cynodegmi]|uniref:Uncharacterized protein n=1 Tax=Capnocytophaga cynodegmi TaxID=28189 RepID=A0A0B7H7W5_9FLAO|nr:hypothetical protein CCYN2B_170095 [Capnocytophaga cynodegmi]